MQEPTHYSPTSIAYARALLELADERKLSLPDVRQELDDLRGIIASDDAMRLYLADPAIGSDQRAGVIERSLHGKVSPLLYDFLRVLNHKNRLSMLSEISGAYGELLDDKLGRIEVDLTVAQKLTPEQLEQARQKISEALKRDAVVHVYVDENIIGGAVLRVGDRLIDASVKYQLQAIKEKLLESRPK